MPSVCKAFFSSLCVGLLFWNVISDPRPFPNSNASFVETKENVDYVYNRVIRDYPIHTKHYNYTGRLLLGPSRLEVPDFLNTLEVESMEKLFEVFKGDFKPLGQGYEMFTMQTIIPTSAFPSLRTSSSSALHSQKAFSHLSVSRIHHFKFWLSIVDRVTEAAESFFDTKLAHDNIFIAFRTPHTRQIVEFPGCNITRWVHQPHIDQCTLIIDPINGVRCEMRKTGFPIEYSAVLYLNEIETGGGELVFLDLIQGKEGLLHPTSHHNTSKSSISTVSTGERGSSKPPKYKDFMKPIKYETVVEPGFGKLFLFTTTPENAHGIKEIKKGSSDRHTMVIFFVRKELAETWPAHFD